MSSLKKMQFRPNLLFTVNALHTRCIWGFGLSETFVLAFWRLTIINNHICKSYYKTELQFANICQRVSPEILVNVQVWVGLNC